MGYSIESGKNDNRIHFFDQKGQTVDAARKDKLDGVKGWDSNKCSSLWKWFCKDVMGWVVEIKVADKNLLVGRNSALHFIQRNQIPFTAQKNVPSKLLNQAIKTALEGFAAAPRVSFKSAQPTPGKPAPAAAPAPEPMMANKPLSMTLNGWIEKLQSQGVKAHISAEVLTKNGFVEKDGQFTVSNEKLLEFLGQFDKQLAVLGAEGLPAAAAAIAGDAPVHAADDGMQVVPAAPHREERMVIGGSVMVAMPEVNFVQQFGPKALSKPRTEQQWVNLFATMIGVDLRDLGLTSGEFFRRDAGQLTLTQPRELSSALFREFARLPAKEQEQFLKAFQKGGIVIEGFLPEIADAIRAIQAPARESGVAGLLMPPAAAAGKSKAPSSLQERHPASISAVLERLRAQGKIGQPQAPAAAARPAPAPVAEKPAARREEALQQPAWLAEGTPEGLEADLSAFRAIAKKLTAEGLDASKGGEFYQLALGIAQINSKAKGPFATPKKDKVKEEIQTVITNLKNLPIIQHFWVVDLLNQPGITNQGTRDMMIAQFNERCKTASAGERAQMTRYIEQEREKAPAFYGKIKVS